MLTPQNSRSRPISRCIFLFFAFLWGWGYYLVAPYLAAPTYAELNMPLGEELEYLVWKTNSSTYFYYLATTLVAFLVGLLASLHSGASDQAGPSSRRLATPAPSIIAWLSLVALTLLLAYSYYDIRDALFKGYAAIAWDERNDSKALMSGCNILLSFLTVYYLAGGFSIAKGYSALLLVNSVMLLGLGGRMYVLCAVIAVFGLFVSIHGINWRKILYIVLFGLLMLIIGLMRQDDSVSWYSLFFIFLGEPSLNWLGAGNFLTGNTVGYFEAPLELVAAVAGFVPTIIWPTKFEFLAQFSLSETFYFFSPVGGSNFISNFLSNFGWVGSAIAIGGLGYFGGRLTSISFRSTFGLAVFLVFASLLPFMFFRDPITIYVKNMFFNGVILPFIVIFLDDKLAWR